MTEDAGLALAARAREEIEQLAQYLEQGLRSLREVAEPRHGSPAWTSVLDELRDVMRITEAATERMLDETEALVDDGHAASRLLADVRRRATGAGAEAIAEPMRELGALIDRANDRAMEIMSALEFQDLTTQKVQRTFGVLEEVLVRVGRLQHLIGAAAAPAGSAPPAAPACPSDQGTSGQRLADELTLHFAANMDA